MNELHAKTYTPMDSDDRNMAVLAHLSGLIASFLGGASFIGPLVFYFISRDRDPALRAHILEALNFSITTTIAFWALGASMVLFITIPFALIAVAVVGIAYFVYSILGAVDASKSYLRRYPFTLRLITS